MKAILFALLIFTTQTFAKSTYDYNSGNLYNTNSNTTYGSNANTGSSWSTTTEPDHTRHGTAANGNHWDYNPSTGETHKANGQTCYGKGTSRVCY